MTRIIGHRGARNLWPENSLSGFRKTADLNIAGVEFDLHLTNAGEVIVLHDPTLERTTNGIGDVAELSKTARVNTFLRESMEEHIPLFEEVLEIFKPTGMELHVELKNRANGDLYDGLTDAVVQIIRAQGMEDQCILTGFTRQVLEQVKDIAPEMRRLASLNAFSATILGGLQ
ncbi:glycerophosphodiester phosphodiesterase family protein [Ochrobactrum sp. SFR4]|uniref:glycerophosphodiester phosphodiesterase family protein n=1 Tax=Ochrobactrum sp. SFR4 TaxID=2717368 RepID=UPI002570E0E8|nr:glycerophosphodiester phosphodiesterase family protein [Ochrobactrum sp. SFR4]